ncbi:Olfactory Receptor 5R1 [Manis pentadactyla]|nr:Olfactory Receptor 5R1 [Manis pentadactyla]
MEFAYGVNCQPFIHTELPFETFLLESPLFPKIIKPNNSEEDYSESKRLLSLGQEWHVIREQRCTFCPQDDTIQVLGNLGLITLIRIDARLHTPMYYFLSHLAFVDLCYSSAITPKMMVNFVVECNTIPFHACTTQLGCFLTFMITECFLLASMAYDRYVAICSPLHYSMLMSTKVCIHRINSQNGKQNEYVRDKNDKKRENGIETSKYEEYQCFDVFVEGLTTSQTNQGNIITVEVMYYV